MPFPPTVPSHPDSLAYSPYLPLVTTQGEVDATTSTTDTREETLERCGGQTASDGQDKPEGEKAEDGAAGSGEGAAASANRNCAGPGHGAGNSLGSWEREGLRPLLEVRFGSLGCPLWGAWVASLLLEPATEPRAGGKHVGVATIKKNRFRSCVVKPM